MEDIFISEARAQTNDQTIHEALNKLEYLKNKHAKNK